jgi:hypothetical protein
MDTQPSTVPWTRRHLRVTRLRLVSEPGVANWDVSYCTGRLHGIAVAVQLPFHKLPKEGYTRAIVEYAKKDGVFAKGIGILDNISLLD